MDTVLTIDQLERELDSVRAENLRMRQDLHDVRNINDQLRKKINRIGSGSHIN